jgi:stage II sporulation protein D
VRLVLLLNCLLVSAALGAETMRIAVGGETRKAVIDAEGLQRGDDVDDGAFAATGGARATVTLEKGHLVVDGAVSGEDAVRFHLAAELTSMSVNGTHVRGDVVVLKSRDALQVVNVLPLEEYLAGVLGSEMPRSFPLEALKAQAVAARTYALNKKLEQYGQPFHLGSSVISQVYKGLENDDQRTRQAIEATRGLVITFNLQPIEAYFHASCGGRTESGLEALGRDLPYLKPVDCPCGKLATSHWTLTLGTADLKSLGAAKGSALLVQGRSPTGRARRVEVGTRSLDAVTFRERLGYMRLKSLAFDVEKSKDGFVLEGRGFGHGAGLCQWGARVYAEKGWDYQKILQHYYPGTELQALYE